MKALAIIVLVLLAAPSAAAAGAGPEAVGRQQALVRERMQEVERRLLELADLLEPQDPARAAALRRALTVSRQEFVVANMANVESLLHGGTYGIAAQIEEQVLAALRQLGDILGEDAQPAGLQALLAAEARLADLVKRQADAIARTQASAGDADALRAAAEAQRAIAGDVKALADDLCGAPPSDDLKAALSMMADAEAALSAGRKADGLAAQTAAQKRLEEAGRALREAIARRQRADQAQARGSLVAALQRMLAEQRAIRAETEGLAREAAAGPTGRAYRLRALALAERQKALGTAAAAALDALVKDGTTVALPAALRQVKEDVAECARLLGEARTGPEVTAVQEGVESALASLIDAFQAAQQAEVEQRQTPQEQAAEEEGRKPPLVKLGQQLKVLRALQLGVNAQTGRLDGERRAGGLDAGALRSQASRLAERQGDLVGVARSLELDDVAAGMERAQGLLKEGETGEAVRSVQGGVVAQLDALIVRYEEQSQRSIQGKPQEAVKPSPKGGAETPTRAAQESTVPPGDWRRGRLPEAAQLPGGWAPGLPPAEQKKIADTFITGRLPGRYVEMLREYNKRLAE